MTRDKRRQLVAERGELQRILNGIPTENVLDRSSFEARLSIIEGLLESAAADTRPPVRARITFRGRPVVGSHGIFAEFGVTATKSFADVVSLIAASRLGPLASTGPVPNRDQNQLLITSTAVGSFGFELEEHREGQLLLDDESAVADALAQTQRLLEATAGTDDELTDVAAGVDPRVIYGITSFLKELASNEAICAVEYGDRRFAFKDVGQVRRGIERLATDNLHEEVQTYSGEFQGVLPKRRTFEFKITNEETVLVGKIGPAITEPDDLNKHLHQLAHVSLVATRVGSGRPRFVLNSIPTWNSDNSQ